MNTLGGQWLPFRDVGPFLERPRLRFQNLGLKLPPPLLASRAPCFLSQATSQPGHVLEAEVPHPVIDFFGSHLPKMDTRKETEHRLLDRCWS